MKHPVTEQITFIYVRDLGRSSAFYEDLLGFVLVVDQGSCRIVKTVGDAYIGYCEKGGGVDDPAGVILTFVTPHVDEWYARLEAAGVEMEGKPVLNERFGIYHFFLTDPDGYKLEFQRFIDSNWHKKNG